MRPERNSKPNDKFSSKGKKGDFGKKRDFDEERKPSVFDRAFQDPDKAKRQRERDELIGPREERVFSKSLDDETNPKYGSNPLANKTGFTKKEKDKYKERFPQRAARDEQSDRRPSRNDRGDRNERGGNGSREGRREGGFDKDRREGGYRGERKDYKRDDSRGDNRDQKNPRFNRERREGENERGGYNKDRREGGFDRERRDGGNRGERKDFKREGSREERRDQKNARFNRDRKEGENEGGGFNKDRRSGGFDKDRRDSGYRGERKDFKRDETRDDRRGPKNERFSRDKREGDQEGGFKKDNRFSKEGGRGNFDKGGKGKERKAPQAGLKKFEKFIKPEKEKIEGLDDYKFRTRFTSFDDQNKAYSARKERNAQNKFDGKDQDLENSIKADYNPEAKMPLNKFLSRSGVCSRRDAVEIIKAERVTVNGEVVTEPGYKVQEMDLVKLDNKKVKLSEAFVYVLMNKPKGYITTLDDPKGRRIISELYEEEIPQRIFPIGRLDRNTTGLLLLTNDGDLSNQLAHPKYQIKKIYQVKLDKPVTQPHMQDILNGLELEDGVAEVDQLSYLTAKDEIGIEIHSGKNRIVRRIFEHLGYDVEKLDRVLYAGLTKKNLPKGKWRFLSRQEVINLKHLGKNK